MRQEQPRGRLYVAQGHIADRVAAILGVQGPKIDWRVSVDLDAHDIRSREAETLGSARDALRRLVEFGRKWEGTASVPEFSRVAIGAILLVQTGSRGKSAATLRRCLPFAPVDEDCSDFLYRVNRRRASKVEPGRMVNRLATWSVHAWRQVAVSVDDGQRQLGPEKNAARLELDINTVPGRTEPIPNASIAGLVSEFVEMGLEIAEKGDVK
jgi:hypothetical protein